VKEQGDAVKIGTDFTRHLNFDQIWARVNASVYCVASYSLTEW